MLDIACRVKASLILPQGCTNARGNNVSKAQWGHERAFTVLHLIVGVAVEAASILPPPSQAENHPDDSFRLQVAKECTIPSQEAFNLGVPRPYAPLVAASMELIASLSCDVRLRTSLRETNVARTLAGYSPPSTPRIALDFHFWQNMYFAFLTWHVTHDDETDVVMEGGGCSPSSVTPAAIAVAFLVGSGWPRWATPSIQV